MELVKMDNGRTLVVALPAECYSPPPAVPALPAPGVAFLSGQTWWGMGIQLTPSATGAYDPTNIQGITFQ